MIPTVIIGSGGFGIEVLSLIRDYNSNTQTESKIKVLGFISQELSGTVIHGVKILGNDEWAHENLPLNTHFIIALGNGSVRKKLARKWESRGFIPQSVIHPSVIHSPHINFGQGNIICARSTLTTDITLGKYVVINLHCTVGHDAIIHDYSTLAPGVHISGNVVLEEEVEVGSGAVILPGVSLGKRCVLGAGAVATKRLEGGITYIGCPARPLVQK